MIRGVLGLAGVMVLLVAGVVTVARGNADMTTDLWAITGPRRGGDMALINLPFHIDLLHPESGLHQQLVTGRGFWRYSRWFPQMQRLVIDTEGDVFWLDWHKERLVSFPSGSGNRPVIEGIVSPDGQQIVWPDSASGIRTPFTSPTHRLNPRLLAPGLNISQFGQGMRVSLGHIAWSPDSEWVYIAGWLQSQPNAPAGLVRSWHDGSEVTTLFTLDSNSVVDIIDVTSDWLIFGVSAPNKNDSTLYWSRLDGQEAHNMTIPGDINWLSLAPSNAIVVAAIHDDNHYLWIEPDVEAVSVTIVPVQNGEFRPLGWSPDGRYLVSHVGSTKTGFWLTVMAADGSEIGRYQHKSCQSWMNGQRNIWPYWYDGALYYVGVHDDNCWLMRWDGDTVSTVLKLEQAIYIGLTGGIDPPWFTMETQDMIYLVRGDGGQIIPTHLRDDETAVGWLQLPLDGDYSRAALIGAGMLGVALALAWRRRRT